MTAPGPIWTNNSTSDAYIPTTVSVGNRGTQVFTYIDGFTGHSRFFSASDHNPPTPVWQGTNAYYSQQTKVASDEDSDVHVALGLVRTVAGGPLNAVLSRYSCTSSTPLWTYTFPLVIGVSEPLDVKISRDGQTIVAWAYNFSTAKTEVAVFQPNSIGPNAQPVSYTGVNLLSPPQFSQLTPDGSHLYLVSALKNSVFDVHAGVETYSAYNDQHPQSGNAISGDAETLLLSDTSGNAHVYRHQGNGYSAWFNYHLPETVSTGLSSAALSSDGSTLVLGWSYNTFDHVRIQVLDLSSNLHPVLFEEVVQGGGVYQNTTTAITMSDDGSICGIGLSGDQFGLAPEVLVYARDPQSATWSRVYQYNLPGSVQDMRMSANGRFLAVASKAVHNNVLGGGGRVDLFQLGHHDLTLENVPHAGMSVSIHQYLAAGGSMRLFASAALADSPHPFGPYGTLYLDPNLMTVVGSATGGADGIATVHLNVPALPTSIGTSIYLQGFSNSPRHLSQDWVTMTVLP